MKTGKKIAYFAGCTANFVDPEVGKATIKILERNGFSPEFPNQKCCAIPKLIYGDEDGCKKYAEYNVESLGKADCDIVSACVSCVLMIKREYPAILKDMRKLEAEKLALRIYDIMEYLVMLRERNELNDSFQPVNLNIVYHAPCHLKVAGEDLVKRRLSLIRLIPGIRIEYSDRGCCGMGGTFGFKRDNYNIAMEVGKTLFEEIKRISPDMVITECPTCKMQIEQGTGIQVRHPIMIIKEAYGL